MGQFDQTPMFAGELAFLSNFDQTPFRMPLLDVEVASAEHAFNALKTVDPGQQRYVLEAPTPGESKRRGRWVALRRGWDVGGRVWAMQRVLTAKFTVPALSVLLADTGDLRLVETNHWHDWARRRRGVPQLRAILADGRPPVDRASVAATTSPAPRRASIRAATMDRASPAAPPVSARVFGRPSRRIRKVCLLQGVPAVCLRIEVLPPVPARQFRSAWRRHHR